MGRARELLEPAGQGALDLGVEPTLVLVPLLAAPQAQPGLFATSGPGAPLVSAPLG
jgi:hypothetical protein